MSERLKKMVPIFSLGLLIILSTAYYIHFIHKSYLGVPFQDGLLGLPLLDKYYSGTLSISDLFQRYEEHLIPFYYILSIANGLFYHYNTLLDSYVYILSYILTTVILIRYLFIYLKPGKLRMAASVLVILANFSLVQAPQVFMSSQFALSIVFMLLILLSFDTYYFKATVKNFFFIIVLFGVYQFLFSGAYSAGVYVSIGLFSLVGIVFRSEKKKLNSYSLLIISFIAVGCLYYIALFGLHKSSESAGSGLGFFSMISLMVKSVLAGFSASVLEMHYVENVIKNPGFVLFIGFCLFSASFLLMMVFVHFDLHKKTIFPLLLMIYPIPISIVTTLSRSAVSDGWMWPLKNWYSFHYKMYLLAVIIMAFMIIRHYGEMSSENRTLFFRNAIAKIAAAALVGYCCLSLISHIVINRYMWRLSPKLMNYYQVRMDALKKSDVSDGEKFYVSKEELQRCKAIIEKYRLVYFK